MTDNEWKEVRESLFAAFPDLKKFLMELGGDEQYVVTTRVWRKTLGEFSKAECLKIIDDWTTGKKEPFKPFERDRVALIMRAYILGDRSRNARFEQSEAVKDKRKTGDFGFGVACGKIPELIAKVKEGVITQSEFERELTKAAAAIGCDSHREPSYRCAECRDTGLIQIYDPAQVHRYKNDKQSGFPDEASCACSCENGNVFRMKEKPLLLFDPGKHCRCKSIGFEMQQMELADWMKNYRTAREWVG